jgi:hypothetical protein
MFMDLRSMVMELEMTEVPVLGNTISPDRTALVLPAASTQFWSASVSSVLLSALRPHHRALIAPWKTRFQQPHTH